MWRGESSRAFLGAEMPCGALTRDLGQDRFLVEGLVPLGSAEVGDRALSKETPACRSPRTAGCGVNYSPSARRILADKDVAVNLSPRRLGDS
jgi:hypothetical protein